MLWGLSCFEVNMVSPATFSEGIFAVWRGRWRRWMFTPIYMEVFDGKTQMPSNRWGLSLVVAKHQNRPAGIYQGDPATGVARCYRAHPHNGKNLVPTYGISPVFFHSSFLWILKSSSSFSRASLLMNYFFKDIEVWAGGWGELGVMAG